MRAHNLAQQAGHQTAVDDDQQNIREAILEHCSRFPDEYWLEHDRSRVFPNEFYESLLKAGWLGVAMPTEYGGSGLGHYRSRGDDAGDRRVRRWHEWRIERSHPGVQRLPRTFSTFRSRTDGDQFSLFRWVHAENAPFFVFAERIRKGGRCRLHDLRRGADVVGSPDHFTVRPISSRRNVAMREA
jgi:hypothetical protein